MMGGAVLEAVSPCALCARPLAAGEGPRLHAACLPLAEDALRHAEASYAAELRRHYGLDEER
jgi:hypothetical protein